MPELQHAALRSGRIASRILLWSATSALAGFLFGFDTVVISGAEQKIQSLWNLSAAMQGVAVASALYGTVLGSALGGCPTDRFGRRATLILIGVLYLSGALWSAFSTDVHSFICARLLGGLGIGISTVAAPLIGSFGYIASLGLVSWAFFTGHYAIVPVCIFAFIAAHAIGQGAVIWVFIAEIFPSRHRAAGQSLGSFTHWCFAALLTSFFPTLVSGFAPGYVFAFFTGMMVLQLIWVRTSMIETKGESLEAIQDRLT